jgi:outer membrane protein TolC
VFRIAITFLVALVIVVPGTETLAQRVLTVDEAVTLGLQNDETFLIAKEDLERAAGQIREAWAGALPKLSFDARYTRAIEIPERIISLPEDMGGTQKFKMGTNHDYAFGLTLTQPLYVGGKVGAALKIAKYYRQMSEARLKQAENDVVYEIKSAFFHARLAEDVVGVYQDAVNQADLNLANARKLFDQGMAAEFDVLRAEVELANLKPQLIKAQNDVILAGINLKNRLGISPEETLELSFEFDGSELDRSLALDSGLDEARDHHPAVLQLDFATKGYQKAISIARGDLLPQLSASSEFTLGNATDRFSPDDKGWTRDWSASLLLSMPIFDGRAASGRIKQAKADYNQSRLTLQQTKENVQLAVRSAHASWQQALSSLQSQEKTVTQAEEGLRIANLRYQNGVGTQLEVLAAQTAVTQAKVNYINAIYDYELSVAEFERATGADLRSSGE